MTKSSMSLWDRFLFRDRGIVPTKRLLIIITVLSIVLLCATIFHIPWTFMIAINLFFIVVSLLDLFFSPNKKEFQLKREISEEIERGKTYSVRVVVENKTNYKMNFRFVDDLPTSFQRPFPVHGTVDGQNRAAISYETKASARGKYEIKKLYFRFHSVFGLWEKQWSVETSNTVKVIPDLTSMKNYLENAQRFLLHEGVKIKKEKTGAGEFSKIRNYVIGDDPRKINWRQTAKLQEVMMNEYEPEHGKYITLLIDCGRMMGAELKEGNRLEKSLEASLTVAAAALQKGDHVSVLAFSKNVKRYVPPAKGMDHLQTILQAVYNMEVDAVESNYGAVLNYLQTVQTKRSLILLFSDVRTFLFEETALAYLQRLRRRHLFIMIGIDDKTLQKRISSSPTDVEAAMIKSVAQQQYLLKKKEKLRWENGGLLMVEAEEERLASTAVSYYIEMMNRGEL